MKILSIVIFSLFFCQSVAAEQFHGRFLDWSLFSAKQGKDKVCYMVSLPLKKSGDYDKRGQPYFIVSSIGRSLSEISISGGYDYKNNSQVELSFGLKKFYIFAYDNLAWANNRYDDIEIIKAMRAGDDVVVSAVASNNTYSEDTYSLIGFVKAFRAMKDLCK